MNGLCLEHVSEDLLERYLARQGSGTEVDAVETHLLICDSCQERLTDLEDYRSAIRSGFALLAAEEEQLLAAVAQGREGRGAVPHQGWSLPVSPRGWLSGLVVLTLPRWSPRWAMLPAAAVLALAVILVVPAMRRVAAPVEVSLTVERGSETTVAAPRGRNLRLLLDSAGLPDGQVSVEVVDSTGTNINQQQAVTRSNHVTIGVSHMASGLYYVRIYSSKNGQLDSDRLLREFALHVK